MNDEICTYNPLDTNKIQKIIYQKLEISNLNQDLEEIMQSPEVVRIIASLSKSIIELANNKNEVALSIIQQATTGVADYIIDLGPKAGLYGGEIVFQGKLSNIDKSENSLTAKYLRKEILIPIPKKRGSLKDTISIKGIFQNNLQNINQFNETEE